MTNFCNGVIAICPARLSGNMRCRLQSHSESQLWQLSSKNEKQPSVSILSEGKRDAHAYPAGLLRWLGRSVWMGSGSQKTLHTCKMASLYGRRLAERCMFCQILPLKHSFPQHELSKLLFQRNVCLPTVWWSLLYGLAAAPEKLLEMLIGALPLIRMAAPFRHDQTILPRTTKTSFLIHATCTIFECLRP